MAHLTAVIPSLPLLSRPYVPELDFAGVVDLAGPDAPATMGPGARVFGSVPLSDYLLHGRGSMAESVLVPVSEVAVLPQVEGFGLAEASALNGNGQTALLMVRNAGVKKGSRVFVNGGSGGVGTLAVQIAKAEGAYVVATGSRENAALVKSLGADEVRTLLLMVTLIAKVIDYRTHSPLPTYLEKEYSSKPFDAILDTIGVQALYENSPAYLEPGGQFVNVGAMEGVPKFLWSNAKNNFWPKILGGTPRKYMFQQTNPTVERLQYLVKLVAEGKLRVIIDQVFMMDDALKVRLVIVSQLLISFKAYERIISQRAKGKVVVQVQKL
jgi:NADPH:quinone reductase-like Zn-dependent oxidoreductase